MLHSFVCALNLDGSLAPFYAEKARLDALTAHHAGLLVRIDGSDAVSWMVTEFYAALDETAAIYLTDCNRPPQLRELLHYVETSSRAPTRNARPVWPIHNRGVLGREVPREPKAKEAGPFARARKRGGFTCTGSREASKVR